jgi:peptidoglycan/LPS O-acetylase OafA/YrhL
MPVKARMRELGVPLGIQNFVCTTLVTYALAAVTYALIERPFMRGPSGRGR